MWVIKKVSDPVDEKKLGVFDDPRKFKEALHCQEQRGFKLDIHFNSPFLKRLTMRGQVYKKLYYLKNEKFEIIYSIYSILN